MHVNWNWVLIVVGAVLVLLEVSLGGFAGFDLVLVGSSFVLGGILGLAVGSPITGLVAASVLCLLYIAVGRRWVRKRLKRPDVHTNTDALIGQRALVKRAISTHQPGQVRLRGEDWLARPVAAEAGTLESGTEVIVESVDGVTLIVRRS